MLARSRKTQKRNIEAAATADALASVFKDKTSMTNSVANAATRIISPMKDVNLIKNDTPVSMQKMAANKQKQAVAAEVADTLATRRLQIR